MKNVRLICSAALMVAVLGMAPPRADAAPVTLTDDNSVLNLDPTAVTGVDNWFVDGTDQLFQQWFWYRIGATGPESPLNTLPLVLSGTSDTDFDGNTDTVYTRYQSGHLRVEVTYTLSGGTVGSKSSDLSEVIKITNIHPTDTVSLSFFEYTDFDLAGAAPDSASMVNPNLVVQRDNAYFASESVSVTPTRFEVNTYPNTLNSLQDGSATNLNNVSAAGPGDVTWAFQWDANLAPNSVFQLSKNKMVGVPEPTTLLLFGTALFGAAGAARKRRAQQQAGL